MLSLNTNAQDGKAKTIKKAFSRQTSISIEIKSDPAIIWALLTNAEDFPRWNSTVVFIKGEIKKDEKLELKVKLDEKRTFKVKVKEFEPENRMLWSDGKGNRVFLLEQTENGTVIFTMDEKMGGLMFPMYSKYIPPFDETFEQYAADLKKEAELIFKAKN